MILPHLSHLLSLISGRQDMCRWKRQCLLPAGQSGVAPCTPPVLALFLLRHLGRLSRDTVCPSGTSPGPHSSAQWVTFQLTVCDTPLLQLQAHPSLFLLKSSCPAIQGRHGEHSWAGSSKVTQAWFTGKLSIWLLPSPCRSYFPFHESKSKPNSHLGFCQARVRQHGPFVPKNSHFALY